MPEPGMRGKKEEHRAAWPVPDAQPLIPRVEAAGSSSCGRTLRVLRVRLGVAGWGSHR